MRLSQVAICAAINQLSDLFTTNHTADWRPRLMNSNPKGQRDEDQEHNRVDHFKPAHHSKIDSTDRPCQIPEGSNQHRQECNQREQTQAAGQRKQRKRAEQEGVIERATSPGLTASFFSSRIDGVNAQLDVEHAAREIKRA